MLTYLKGQVALYSWTPNLYFRIQLLCLCWMNNKFTYLATTKPVKLELSHTGILPLTKNISILCSKHPLATSEVQNRSNYKTTELFCRRCNWNNFHIQQKAGLFCKTIFLTLFDKNNLALVFRHQFFLLKSYMVL